MTQTSRILAQEKPAVFVGGMIKNKNNQVSGRTSLLKSGGKSASVKQRFKTSMVRRRGLVISVMLGCAIHVVAENIVFSDTRVKALCIANWDDDNDGELSIDEAAAVTSLGRVFREKTDIRCFNELKYFTGLGSIDDYAFYKSSLETLVLPPTVTLIGDYAFSQSNISGEMVVPGTVKNIGDYSFYSCQKLTSVILEEGVETVGWHAISGPVSVLSLPSSLTSASSMFIDPYVSASSGIFIPEGDLTVVTHAEIPAAINSMAFYYVFSKAHLICPPGSIEVYRSASGWSKFGEYLEAGDVNRDGRLDIADVTLLIAFIQGREHTETEARIADVNGDGVLDGDDVTLLCSYILG